jgi:hypothetical protein
MFMMLHMAIIAARRRWWLNVAALSLRRGAADGLTGCEIAYSHQVNVHSAVT